MAQNNAVNLSVTNNAVGVTVGGGTTKRNLTWNGAGDTTFTAQTSGDFTLPNQAADTLVGYSSWTAKGALIAASAANTPVALPVGTDGQYLQANSAAASGLSWASSATVVWSDITSTSQTMSPNNGYIANNASLVTLTLPTTAVEGTVIEIAGKGTGGWKIAQNAGQVIHFGNSDTTVGTGGSLQSLAQRDCIKLLCVVANTEWNVLSAQGNIGIT